MKYADFGSSMHRYLIDRVVTQDVAEVAAALAEVGAVIGDQVHGPWFDENGLTGLVFHGMSELLPSLHIIDNRGTSREFRTGSDWEWWIEGRAKWFHALVQAKKLKGDRLVYDMAYKTSDGRLQAAKLVEASRRMHPQAAPLYVLYNERPEEYLATAGCLGEELAKEVLKNLDHLPALSAGVTVISGEAALALAAEVDSSRGKSAKTVGLDDVAELAASWICLATCAGMDCSVPPAWRGWPLTPKEVLWHTLGFDGEYDGSDLAFQFALTYVSTSLHAGGSLRRSVLDSARASLVDDPTDQFLNENLPPSIRFEELDAESIPRWTLILRRSRLDD